MHRDLKPVQRAGQPKTVACRFSTLAWWPNCSNPPIRHASMQSRHFAGTPRYAAPEQAFGERTAATDWYALGTMLYRSLAG